MQKDLPQVVQRQDIVLISKEKFLTIYSPNNCLKHAGKLQSIEDVLQKKTTLLSDVGRQYGDKFARAFLMIWLVYLNEMLALNKPMKEAQIEFCAERILEQYYFFSFADLSFLFNRIISGGCGEFYESLSPAKLLTFFRDYFSERIEVAEQKSLREHYEFRYQEQKNESYTDNLMRKMKKMYR